MKKILAAFPETVRQGFAALMDCEYGEVTIRQEGTDYVIESPREWAFWYRLTLKDASGLPEKRGCWRFDPFELKSDGDGYLLTGYVSDLDWEEEWDAELRFSDMDAQIGPLALELSHCGTRPWQSLAASGMELLRKESVAPKLVNDRERDLLPLLQELGMLCGWTGLPEPDTKLEFPLLRKRFGPELHPLLDRIEGTGKSWKKERKHSERLLKRLNRIEYLPLWQSIRDELEASQMGYPQCAHVSPDVIRQIEDGLYARGYSGSYPSFVKFGSIAGHRDIKSYGNIHWVRKGTPAVFHIRVQAQSLGNLTFHCGTELMREGEESLGFDSCYFNAKGRRFLRREVWSGDDGNLDRTLNIAAKKAELIKLSKEERPDREILWPLFWTALSVGGTFFAVVMVLALAVIAGLLALALKGPGEMWEVLASIPWMQTFFQCLVASGVMLGAMVLMDWDDT